MRPFYQSSDRTFTITEENLIQTVIKVRNERRVFSDDGPTQMDCENLERISSDECSEETKDIIVNFMLKFGKLYKKDFEYDIDRLHRFELKYLEPHRDHVCHSFYVWSLGLWLYGHGFKQYFNSVHEKKELFDFVWYLTAFYHDIGYVENHSYHGGDSAQKLLKNLNSRFSGNWTTDAIHAIVAICLHDRKQPVDLLKEPYTALLILCDELQEWGRNIPGNQRRSEIDKLRFHLDLSRTNPSIDVVLCYPYPKKQTDSIDELEEYVKIKEKELNRKFFNRIQNLTIVVKCKVYGNNYLIDTERESVK